MRSPRSNDELMCIQRNLSAILRLGLLDGMIVRSPKLIRHRINDEIVALALAILKGDDLRSSRHPHLPSVARYCQRGLKLWRAGRLPTFTTRLSRQKSSSELHLSSNGGQRMSIVFILTSVATSG